VDLARKPEELKPRGEPVYADVKIYAVPNAVGVPLEKKLNVMLFHGPPPGVVNAWPAKAVSRLDVPGVFSTIVSA
jgi:hypothetical protein